MKISKGAGATAPDIEIGSYPARFDGVALEEHPDWAQPKGTVTSFGRLKYDDDGSRLRFNFTLLDSDDEELYDDGEPVEVSAMTRNAFGSKSNAFALFKPLLTAAELAAFEAGEDFDTDAVDGRLCFVEIGKNKNDWPIVASTMARPTKRAAAGGKTKISPPARVAAQDDDSA